MIRYDNLHLRYDQIKETYHTYTQDIMIKGKVFIGHYTSLAEHKLQKITGRKHAALTSSCSASLLISMYLAGITKGDEVITTAYSCPPSETFIHLVGATPVFVDVDNSGNMKSDLIESLITDRTRAIVATGLYGDMHDHKNISDLCNKYNLMYVNDAAQSMFSHTQETTSLSTGDLVCMSFAENKPLPSLAGGGAILTDNSEFYYKILHLRNHGKPGRTLPYTHFGIRGMPDEDFAAQLLCSMDHFDNWQLRRHKIAAYYNSEFSTRGVNVRPNSDGWNTHKYAVMFDDKFEALLALANEGIECHAHYPDVLPRSGSYPGAELYAKQSLSIPLNAHMTDYEVEEVVNKVEKVWKNKTI